MTTTATTTLDDLRAKGDGLSPSKLAHVVFLTDQYDVIKDWYMTVLNATVAFENPMLCFLRYDDEHHRIGIIKAENLAQPEAPAPIVEHVSFTYDSLADLFATFLRLREAGITPFWTINHGPTMSFYYKDPDGHHVELQYDNLDDDQIDAFFAGGAYERNPIGVIVDADDLIERFLAGEDEATLTARPELPEGANPFDQIRH